MEQKGIECSDLEPKKSDNKFLIGGHFLKVFSSIHTHLSPQASKLYLTCVRHAFARMCHKGEPKLDSQTIGVDVVATLAMEQPLINYSILSPYVNEFGGETFAR